MTTSDDEWQRLTTSDNEWQQVTNKDNEWKRVIKRMETNKSKQNSAIFVSKLNKRPIWFLNNFIQFFMQYIATIRNSRSQMFFKIGVYKNFAIFTGKHLCWGLFLIKLQAWRTRPVAASVLYIHREFGNIYKSWNWWHILIETCVSIRKQPLEVFYQKAVLNNFAIFTGKHLCWSLFLIKLQPWWLAALLKRNSNTGVFL